MSEDKFKIKNGLTLSPSSSTISEVGGLRTDTNGVVRFWNGSTWVTTESLSNILTTKGDILRGEPSGDIARIDVGANNRVLTVDTNQASSLNWLSYRDPNKINPNYIINGNFDIWQRTTNASITGFQTDSADRWRFFQDGSGMVGTISRQTTDLPTGSNSFLRLNVTNGGVLGSFCTFRQGIEGVHHLASKSVTISFLAKSTTSSPIFCYIWQYFGDGGGESAPWYSTGQTFNLTPTWQRYSITRTMESIVGKNIGASLNDAVYLEFSLPVNQPFQVDIAQVKVEEGNLVTPFCLAGGNLEGELQACHRYYEQGIPQLQSNGRARVQNGPIISGGNQRWIVPVNYKVTKRAIPQLSVTDIQLYITDGTVADSSPIFGTSGSIGLNEEGFVYRFTTSTFNNNRNGFRFVWTVDSELY